MYEGFFRLPGNLDLVCRGRAQNAVPYDVFLPFPIFNQVSRVSMRGVGAVCVGAPSVHERLTRAKEEEYPRLSCYATGDKEGERWAEPHTRWLLAAHCA